jgi:hypothetical protein
MKKLIYILAGIAAIVGFSSCGGGGDDNGGENPSEEETGLSTQIVGSWHLTSSTYSGVDVWVSFSSSKTFKLYQKTSEEAMYSLFEGNYNVSGDKVTGTYSDGASWGSSYTGSVSGSTLTLDSGTESLSYTKASIPSTVTDNVHSTKSGSETVPLL